MKYISPIFLLALSFSAAAAPQSAAPSAPAEPRQQAAAAAGLNRKLLAELGDSVVRVETFFKVSPSGEMPSVTTRYKCPNCNEYHTSGVEDLIKTSRPVSQPGFVIAPDEVLATDLYLMPEWVDRIEVVFRKRYAYRLEQLPLSVINAEERTMVIESCKPSLMLTGTNRLCIISISLSQQFRSFRLLHLAKRTFLLRARV